MQRIDRYVLRELHGPFWLALVVIMLVLVTDFVPDVVKMVVSKGLPISIIAQVFVLNLAWMAALAIPMAVLSCALMGFGRLAADSEALALKAAGLSVYRLIAPVLIVAAVLAGGLIVFNNEVLPDANHQARMLMSDIRRKRPTLDLKAGVIEDRIPGYHLLIETIDQRSSDIAGVTIFDLKNRNDPRTVVARDGSMEFSADGNTLILSLRDGEIHERDPGDIRKYRRTVFQSQTFYLSGASDEWSRTESRYRTDREKSAQQMQQDIAVWREAIGARYAIINNACSTMVSGIMIGPPQEPVTDYTLPEDRADFDRAETQQEALVRASDRVKRIRGIIEREASAIRNQQRLIDQYCIEIYKKYSIPAACVAFALIGVPLGVRTRRGGIGSGLGISLGLFLLYWAFLIGGEDLADRGIITPFVAMWTADIFIALVGVWLLWSVTNEANLLPSWPRRRTATDSRSGAGPVNGMMPLSERVSSP
ncbi:MAG TPA: LptF/LptG family permease [candidate division Zixibacteria bacterium]|jgi:lipopolysaccharide export system permease protein